MKLGVISLALLLLATVGGAGAGVAAAATDKPGLSQLLAAHDLTSSVRGIATFPDVPSAIQINGLTGLGLKVQPMKKLPLALVAGPVSAMRSAVNSGIATDIYPDYRLQLFDTASSDAMGSAALRQAGWTGKGVTVAVVDSGCDASHPDLANRVKHNVILASGEYVNQHPNGDNTIAVATETGPYQNSDLGSGHGTHVAGIIAADSSSVSDGSRYGVAPDAELVCFAIGLVLFTSAVVTAYDYLLRQPDLWGVDVINNSWGNVFRQFDPNDPVSVITKAVNDLGVTVVFAAGNAGTDEMSMNPFSMAPWVISVGAGNLDYDLGSFSSTGLQFDNSAGGQIGAGGHTVYSGDRIGLYHPDVVAPGVSISSTCDTAGTAIGPCPPGSNATASGTSMAAPHVAGAAAVLLQANPALTPNQVQLALQATARQMVGGNGKPLPFFMQGYGYVDLAAAVALVRSPGWSDKVRNAARQADARVLAADGYRVVRSDFWTYPAPRLALAGSDTQTYTLEVPSSTRFLKVAIAHPGLGVVCCNGMNYDVTVTDAAGTVVAQTTELSSNGSATAFVDLGAVSPAVSYGTFTVQVVGQLAVSDPDTFDSDSLLGRMITTQVAQLVTGK
jgi:serine protease AprX